LQHLRRKVTNDWQAWPISFPAFDLLEFRRDNLGVRWQRPDRKPFIVSAQFRHQLMLLSNVRASRFFRSVAVLFDSRLNGLKKNLFSDTFGEKRKKFPRCRALAVSNHLSGQFVRTVSGLRSLTADKNSTRNLRMRIS
jgi:hypothetical protein